MKLKRPYIYVWILFSLMMITFSNILGYEAGLESKPKYQVLAYNDTIRIPICFLNETWTRCFDREESLMVAYQLDGRYMSVPKLLIFTNNKTWEVRPSFEDGG